MMKLKLQFRTVIYIATSIITITLISAILKKCDAEIVLNNLLDINYFDLLLGQIANTLIVLSLTSVLSSDFGKAYWVDIKNTKLVYPFWGCFIGITVYLLTSMIYSILCFIVNFKIGLVVSAIFSTILLVILTFKMISVYFGKDEIKKQLKYKYKKLIILNQSYYISDYVRKLEEFVSELEQSKFNNKNHFVKVIKREIDEIQKELNAGDETIVDEVHKKHIEKHVHSIKELKDLDIKIVEYTKNAINNNNSETVYENIELLVDCENYEPFINLLEELFDWDEKYACHMLYKLNEKNKFFVIEDSMNFFKKYALDKLISNSGKLYAIQSLLRVYDATNLGMKEIDKDINKIKTQCAMLQERQIEIERKISGEEDFRQAIKQYKTENKKIENEYDKLGNELKQLMGSATAKELRSFYVPIKEVEIAYMEQKYDIVNKYLTVILTNFKQDNFYIKENCGITNIESTVMFTYSYLTDEELEIIQRILEKDEHVMSIPSDVKGQLLGLSKVIVDNKRMDVL